MSEQPQRIYSLEERPRLGVPFTIGGKVFVMCNKCRKLVRIDKPILGSIHLCAP